MTTTNDKRSFLTLTKKFEVFRTLESYLKKNPDGTVKYTHGMSDARVAKKLGVSVCNVSGVRLAEFGALFRKNSSGSGDAAKSKFDSDRVAELERRLTRLEAWISNELGYEA